MQRIAKINRLKIARKFLYNAYFSDKHITTFSIKLYESTDKRKAWLAVYAPYATEHYEAMLAYMIAKTGAKTAQFLAERHILNNYHMRPND